jgi:hypothetical protein
LAIVQSTRSVDGHDVVINIEVDDPSDATGRDFYGTTRDGSRERLAKLQRDLFGEGMAFAEQCATWAAASLDKIAEACRPKEFELQVAIKLDAEVGAVLAKAGAEAQLQVTMRWGQP